MEFSSRDSRSRTDVLCVVDVIGNHHRNRTLRLLRRHGTPMRLDTLAERLDAPAENPFAEGNVTATGDPAAQLHHTHLPKLDDAGIIDYDRDAREVVWFDEDRLDSLLEVGHRLLESLQEEPVRNE